MRRKMLSWSFGNAMSLRFLDDPDDEKAKAEAEKEAAEKQRQAEIAKAKQLADQEAANARKARERVQQLEAENATARAELEALKAKAKEEGIKVPDLNEDDYTDSDVALVQAIKGLNAKIDAKDQRIADLEKQQAERTKAEKDAEAERQKEAVYNSLLEDLDGEYGAQHRNAAVKAFNAMVAEGNVPNNPAKATRMLESCYKDAVKAATKDRRDTDTTLDTGSGGGDTSRGTRTKLKPGSLDEVMAQLQT